MEAGSLIGVIALKKYMSPLAHEGYIKAEHQARLIEGLRQFHGRIIKFSKECREEMDLRVRVERMAQFVILLLLALTFGLAPCTPTRLLEGPSFRETREYIAGLCGKFPGKSSAGRQVGRILHALRDAPHLAAALEAIVVALMDFYYVAVGEAARASFQAILDKTRAQVTPPIECLVGVAKASDLFPSLGAQALGCLLPFFNAWVYKQAKRASSTSELVGELKRPSIDGGRMLFKDAGELGFISGPPEVGKFYTYFAYIESHIDAAWALANKELARLKVHDLTATTVDGTSVPVDKRDTTGSIGTGSRGTFSGHKLSAGAGANCLPVSGLVSGGRVSDVSLLEGTLAPMEQLARECGQDTWVDIMDAGYSSPGVVDRVEAGGAVPFVDINPKNSERLQALKDAARAITDLSKKAVKEGLEPDERKAWLGEARAISEEKGERVPVEEKKSS
jgi:hypothetical protein